jgi:hypothetical protein
MKHKYFENLILFIIILSSFKLIVDTYYHESSNLLTP